MRLRNVIMGLVSVVIILVPVTVGRAQTPIDTVLDRVQEYFGEQYGRDYALVRYTYAFQTWADSSLGCPQPGIAYTQGTVEGYQWKLEISDGTNEITTYELHSNLDGSVIVLCTPIDRARLVDYQTYQNGIYLIDYPDTWQINASEDLAEVTISPDGTVACDDIGMYILRLDSVGNANMMLDDALRRAGLVQNVGARIPVNNSQTALTVLYQAACDSNVLQYRATAFPDTSGTTGYLVLQWAPQAQYPNWSNVLSKIIETFRFIDEQSVVETEGEQPVDPARLLAGYPLAHIFVQDVYWGGFDDLPGDAITVGSDRPRRGMAFSYNGQYLAYIDPSPEEGKDSIRVASPSSRRVTIDRDALLAPRFPLTWSPDALQLAYVVQPDEPPAPDGRRALEVRNAAIGDSPQPEVLGNVPFTDNCEPPSTPYTPEQLYWQETGVQGNALTFAWLLDGKFLYTTNCNGTGLAIWDPRDSSLQDLGEDLRRAALSPDRTKLAAIGGDGSVFEIDLVSGERTPLPLQTPADQIAWSHNNEVLYYSALMPGQPFLVDNPALEERAQRVLKTFPYESALNTVTITAYNLADGSNDVRWQGQAYAVGRMVPAPNNAGLLFSVIPSDREWTMAFIEEADPVTLRFARPETELYWLSTSSDEARLLAVTAQPIFAPAVPPSTEDESDTTAAEQR
ncbi:MAG: hypothetical protein GYB66_04435 [Chloroflexi bacterium]|nr:hypothetical protein [Chloroflexota bacterium]